MSKLACLTITVVACAFATGGCVKKSTHQKLQEQLDATTFDLNSKIEERDQRIDELETEVDTKEKKIGDLQTAIQELELEKNGLDEEVARLGESQTQLQNELANVVKDRARLKESAAELQQALAQAKARKVAAEKRIAQYKDLLGRFKSLIDAGTLQVKVVDGRMVLALATDILFDSGSAELSDEGVEAIRQVAEVLTTIPDRMFQIEGHTDNVPIKTRKYPSNWDLAAARAMVVVKTMINSGMPGSALSAASFGEFRPVASNDTDEGRAKNRRIEIVLVPDLSSLPGFDELSKVVE